MLHVFVLPTLIAAMVLIHVYPVSQGRTRGTGERGSDRTQTADRIFLSAPVRHGFRFCGGTDGGGGRLVLLFPPVHNSDSQANPADAAFLPRPEWYFLPVFQWLKLWPGQSALIGVVVLPAIVTTLFVGLPFIDRSLERHPLRRPLAVGTFCLVLGGLISFGILSRVEDRRDTAVVAQMARQERAARNFMDAPFSPLTTGEAARTAAL